MMTSSKVYVAFQKSPNQFDAKYYFKLWMKPNFTIGNKFLRSRAQGLGDTIGNPFWSRCLFGLAILVLRQIGEVNVLKFDNFVVQIGALQSHQTFDLAHAVFLIWFVISLCEEHDKLMLSKTKNQTFPFLCETKQILLGLSIHSWSIRRRFWDGRTVSKFWFSVLLYSAILLLGFFVAVEHFFCFIKIFSERFVVKWLIEL